MKLFNRSFLSVIFFCLLAFASFGAKAGCFATFTPSTNEIIVKWDMSGCDHADDAQTELFEVCWSHGSLSTSANSCNINKQQFFTQTGSFSIPASPAITYDTKTSFYQWYPKGSTWNGFPVPKGFNIWKVLNKGEVKTPAEVVTSATAAVNHCKAEPVMSPGKITVNWDLETCDNIKLIGDYAKVCWSHGATDSFALHCANHQRKFSDLTGSYDIFTEPGATYKISFNIKLKHAEGIFNTFRKDIMQTELTVPISSESQTVAPGAKLVTLGDSYASGDGFYRGNWGYTPDTADDKYNAFTHNKSRECWRATMNSETPGPRLAIEKNMQSISYACKGARVENLHVQYNFLKSKLPDEVSKKWAGSAFIIVGGGNDLSSQAIGDDPEKSWVEIIAACETSRKHCSQEKYKFNNLAVVHDKLLAFYSQLATEASAAKIRVMGYPQIMKAANGQCTGARTISVGEANFMDEQMGRVAVMISGVVNEIKVANPSLDIKYVDSNPYITEGSCAADGGRNANQVKDIHSVVWNGKWNVATDTGRKKNPANIGRPAKSASTVREEVRPGTSRDQDLKPSIDGLIEMPITIPLGAETNVAENKCAADAIAEMKACSNVRGTGGRDSDIPLNTNVKAGEGKGNQINTNVKAGEGKDNQINCNATGNFVKGGTIINNNATASQMMNDPSDNAATNDCDLIRSAISSKMLSIDGNGGRAGATKVNDSTDSVNGKLKMPDVMTDASFHPTRRGWQKFYEALRDSWEK
jgi:hypothetical protein